jgi:hypothetical protein
MGQLAAQNNNGAKTINTQVGGSFFQCSDTEPLPKAYLANTAHAPMAKRRHAKNGTPPHAPPAPTHRHSKASEITTAVQAPASAAKIALPHARQMIRVAHPLPVFWAAASSFLFTSLPIEIGLPHGVDY